MLGPHDAQLVGLDACTATQIDQSWVRETRPLLVTAEEPTRIADAFALLSEPGRVRVLFALLEAGRPVCATWLSWST